jgi:hypothetical protein
MKPYHELLREVRDSLTKENWDKCCHLFSIKNNNLCMSVHGAAQRLVNPQVAKALNIKGTPNQQDIALFLLPSLIATAARAGSVDVHDHPAAPIPIFDYFFAWKNRLNWIKENYYNINLHYLMGMFGLTYDFEKQESTTLDMIQEKLSEAAMWAEENEEFLVKNS